MKIEERKKCLYVIERLNQEFAANGSSGTYVKNLEQYFSVFGHDGEAIIFLLKNIKCDEAQKQHIVLTAQSKIINNVKFNQDDGERKDVVQYVYQMARFGVCVDYAKLTSQMLNIATDSELIKLAQIKGVDVMEIANKFTYDENLKSLLELHKVAPLKFKKKIAEEINYLKEEGVIVSQY